MNVSKNQNGKNWQKASRAPRNGRILEKLGHYDPIAKDKDKQIVLDLERVKYWLGKGAIPSNTVSDILYQKGVEHKQIKIRKARRKRAKLAAHKKGVPFTEAERVEIQKKAEQKTKSAEEKAKAEVEAKKKAEQKAKKEAEAKEVEPKEPEVKKGEKEGAQAEETEVKKAETEKLRLNRPKKRKKRKNRNLKNRQNPKRKSPKKLRIK